MHGIIHRTLKQYITDRADESGWRRVRRAAGVDTELYLPVSHYPDSEVIDVLGTLADRTGHSEAAIKRDFGKYLAPALLDTFETQFERDWTAIDAVEGLGRVYVQVLDEDGDPNAARITTRRSGPDTVVVNYRSRRRLCPLLEGLVEGVAEAYDTDVEIDATSPTPEGLRHVELTVSPG